MSGAELEAICRTNPDMPLSALRARMPAQIVKGRNLRPLFDLNTLRMRMGRFRMKAGCIAWNEREGSKQIKHELAKILGARCINENSTRSFGRDLTTSEVDSLKSVNKGTVPQRSRKKRSAEDDESSFAPTSKRQNTMQSPFSQENPAGHAQAGILGEIFGARGRVRQLNNFLPNSYDRKRGRERPKTDKSEDGLKIPMAKRANAGSHNHDGDPHIPDSYGGLDYPYYGNPASGLSNFPSPDTGRNSRKRDRPWGPDNSDNEADQDPSSPPSKRRNLNIVPAQPKQAMRSAVAASRRPSQMRYSLSQPVDQYSFDDIHFGGSQHRAHTSSHRTMMPPSRKRPDLSLGYGTGPLGEDDSLLPTLQANSYLFDETFVDDISQSAAPTSGFIEPPQTCPNANGITAEAAQPSTDVLQKTFGEESGSSASRELDGALVTENRGESELSLDNSSSNQRIPDFITYQDYTDGSQLISAQDHTQAQHVNESGLDFRHIIPSNAEEEDSIQGALLFSRDEFEIYSGEDAPHTPRNQSYTIQHGLLQRALADIWSLEDPQPNLFHFDSPWRSFTDWQAQNTTHV